MNNSYQENNTFAELQQDFFPLFLTGTVFFVVSIEVTLQNYCVYILQIIEKGLWSLFDTL
jgi:hypothetical protein